MKKGIAFLWGNIPNNLLGGIDRVSNLLASEFYNQGFNCHIIYSGGEENNNPNFISKFKIDLSEKGILALSNYLKVQNVKYIINQRTYDKGYIQILTKAAQGKIPIFSVYHSFPGYEFYSHS